MSKAFFLSIMIHSLFLSVLLFSFKTPEKKATKTKTISLKHIVLIEKKPEKKVTKEIENQKKLQKPKIEKKPEKKKVEKKPKSKPKPKKIIKKKVKKKKKLAKKRVHKRVKKTYKQITKPQKTTTSNQIYTPPPKSYIQLNKSAIYEAIQRAKKYPIIAKRMNIQGVVTVSFTLLPSGEVVNIITSGAHQILQKSAKKTIYKASYEFPKPPRKVKITLPISYVLR